LILAKANLLDDCLVDCNCVVAQDCVSGQKREVD